MINNSDQDIEWDPFNIVETDDLPNHFYEVNPAPDLK